MNKLTFQVVKSLFYAQFYFHLQTAKGEQILGSEGHAAKQSCLASIAAIKASASCDARYEKVDTAGSYSFNLKGANGETIVYSETYPTAAARDRAIAAMKQDAPAADVEDLT